MFFKVISRKFYTCQAPSPRKLTLIYQEYKDRVSDALSQRIQRELQEVHLNAFTTDRLIISPQVPYTVIITQRTMSEGIIDLQHFRPRIREEVHVSNLRERLLVQTGAAMLRCTKAARATTQSCLNV